MLKQHHLYQHHRICTRPTYFMVVVRIQPLIQPVVVHDSLYLSQQMVLGHQCVYIRYHDIPPRIFFPFFHVLSPPFLFYQKRERFCSFLTG